MIQTLLYRLFRQAGLALTAFVIKKALKAAWARLAPKAAPLAAGTLAGLAAQIASAHEGHGALGELHAHGDSLWGLALLAAAVLIGLALGSRK